MAGWMMYLGERRTCVKTSLYASRQVGDHETMVNLGIRSIGLYIEREGCGAELLYECMIEW